MKIDERNIKMYFTDLFFVKIKTLSEISCAKLLNGGDNLVYALFTQQLLARLDNLLEKVKFLVYCGKLSLNLRLIIE